MGKISRSRGGRWGRDRSSRTVDRKPIRPLERQRMRPWLIDLLDTSDCPQLAWLNRKDKKFRVAWKHAAGQNWNIGQDATLFEKWARHTGKFYDGDKPNPKKWKANFRCALNSLPDVEQEPNMGIKRGLNAFKVYRFLDEKKQKKKSKPKVAREEEECEDCDERLEDEEDAVFKHIQRTSRSRRQQRMELDSEGSELGSSPSHDGSVDFEMSRKAEKDEDDHSCIPDRSPLPHFDQICPFQFKEALRSSFSEARFPEAPSPQHQSSDEDNASTTSSALTDQEIVEMLLEEDDDVYNNSQQLWTVMLQNQASVGRLQVPDEPQTSAQYSDGQQLVFFDNLVEDGPSVIVQSAGESRQQDWVYTSLAHVEL